MRAAIGLTLALLAGAALAANPTPTQLLFDTPHFATATVGEALRYERRRVSDPAWNLGPDMTEAVTVTPMAGGATEVTLTPEGGKTRRRRPPAAAPSTCATA
jgi:hypothetical protein